MANPPSKTTRQATACNWCRAHKTKCDAEQPSCRNCRTRGLECVTTDLRRPGQSGLRQEPVGRRAKRTRQRQLQLHHDAAEPARACEPSPTTSTSPSPSLPPSPSERLLAPMIVHDTPLPSIFSAPFNEQEQPPRRPGSAEHSTGPSPDVASTQTSGTTYSGRSSNLTIVMDKTRTSRRMTGSASSTYVLVQWLDLFFARRDFWKPIFPYFQQGLAYSVEVPLPFLSALPPLPTASLAAEYLSIYFSRIHPIYPIVDRDAVQTLYEDLRPRLEGQPSTLSPKDYPHLACLYALFSAAADEMEGEPTETGTRYLEGAYFLYAHLVALPYVPSVQALLLLAVVLRNRNKDGASWEILGQAIRIAQSIGLHRHVSPADHTPHVEATAVADLHSRIWWTAYILERAMELDTGRPSAIQDAECDQILPQPVLPTHSSGPRFNYFGALVQLARIQTSIIQLYYHTNPNRKTREILHEMGRLDRALQDLAAEFPEEIRPGRDIVCPPEEFHLATYVTVLYHQSFIALHRPALMSATGWLRNRVTHLCAGTPWRDRLRYCLCLGAASARAILKAQNDLLLYSTPSRLVTLNHVMLAVLVLSIYVTRIPSSLMNGSDLAMVTTFAEAAEQEYLKIGQDAEFAKGLAILRQQLSEHVASTKPKYGPAKLAQGPPVSGHDEQGTDAPSQGLSPEFDLTVLDDTWSSLWGEDLSYIYFNDADQDLPNAYLLGLPQGDRVC